MSARTDRGNFRLLKRRWIAGSRPDNHEAMRRRQVYTNSKRASAVLRPSLPVSGRVDRAKREPGGAELLRKRLHQSHMQTTPDLARLAPPLGHPPRNGEGCCGAIVREALGFVSPKPICASMRKIQIHISNSRPAYKNPKLRRPCFRKARGAPGFPSPRSRGGAPSPR
jgi:hypothetical protein